MYVDEETKDLWWNHFVEQWVVGGIGGFYGCTGPKLRKIKPHIFSCSHFWDDVVWRHGYNGISPAAAKLAGGAIYDHCRGNFWGMVMQGMVQKGVIKA